MSKLEKQIQRIQKLKDKTITGNLALWEKNIIQVQNTFLAEVITFLQGFEQEAGVITATPANLTFAINSMEQLNLQLGAAGYSSLIDEYVAVSGDLIKHTKKTLTITGIPKAFTTKDITTLGMIQANISNKFSVLGQTATREIVDNLQQTVMGNTTYKDMVKNLTGTIIGTDKRGGLLKRYAGTYAHDAMIETDRGLNLMAANNFNAEYFLYSGPEDQVTRDFCASHVGKVYTKDEINGMSNDQGTDVWMTGGGYGCRHQFIPIAKEMLSEFTRG